MPKEPVVAPPVRAEDRHQPIYIEDFMIDKYKCSCGWKGNGFWDFPEAAWDEWADHAKQNGIKDPAKHHASFTAKEP